jgi:small subunit ribosomal protein S1
MSNQMTKQKWMDGYEVVFGEDVEEKQETEFGKMLSTTTSKNFEEGEVFMGKVVNVGADFVTVDIGYKQEGLVSVKEFQNFDGTLKVKKDDEIEVYLEKLESSIG